MAQAHLVMGTAQAEAQPKVRSIGLPHAVRGDELVVSLPDHLPAAPATAFSIRG